MRLPKKSKLNVLGLVHTMNSNFETSNVNLLTHLSTTKKITTSHVHHQIQIIHVQYKHQPVNATAHAKPKTLRNIVGIEQKETKKKNGEENETVNCLELKLNLKRLVLKKTNFTQIHTQTDIETDFDSNRKTNCSLFFKSSTS